jgi:hypothetical protein
LWFRDSVPPKRALVSRARGLNAILKIEAARRRLAIGGEQRSPSLRCSRRWRRSRPLKGAMRRNGRYPDATKSCFAAAESSLHGIVDVLSGSVVSSGLCRLSRGNECRDSVQHHRPTAIGWLTRSPAARRVFNAATPWSVLRPDGDCPECGTPIAVTIRMALANAPEHYLRSIVSGIRYIRVLATTGGVLCGVVTAFLYAAPFSWMLLLSLLTQLNLDFALALMVLRALVFIAMVALAIGSLLGALAFTVCDRAEIETPSSARDRIAIRAIAIYQCGVNVSCLGVFLFGIAGPGFTSVLLGALILSLLLQAVQISVASRRAAWLLSRSSNRRGFERARSHVVLLPAIMLVGVVVIISPLIAMVMHLELLSRLRLVVQNILDERDQQRQSSPIAASEPRS